MIRVLSNFRKANPVVERSSPSLHRVSSHRSLEIQWMGRPVRVVCDGRCDKAWGLSDRPREDLDPMNPDDFVWKADGELGSAPEVSHHWEGGDNKPLPGEGMNRWCSRQCERSKIVELGEPFVLKDFSGSVFNKRTRVTREESGS